MVELGPDIVFCGSVAFFFLFSVRFTAYLFYCDYVYVHQTKPWWKLKTIVHWPFSAAQRRKLNWVQLAGHKGKVGPLDFPCQLPPHLPTLNVIPYHKTRLSGG